MRMRSGAKEKLPRRQQETGHKRLWPSCRCHRALPHPGPTSRKIIHPRPPGRWGVLDLKHRCIETSSLSLQMHCNAKTFETGACMKHGLLLCTEGERGLARLSQPRWQFCVQASQPGASQSGNSPPPPPAYQPPPQQYSAPAQHSADHHPHPSQSSHDGSTHRPASAEPKPPAPQSQPPGQSPGWQSQQGSQMPPWATPQAPPAPYQQYQGQPQYQPQSQYPPPQQVSPTSLLQPIGRLIGEPNKSCRICSSHCGRLHGIYDRSPLPSGFG